MLTTTNAAKLIGHGEGRRFFTETNQSTPDRNITRWATNSHWAMPASMFGAWTETHNVNDGDLAEVSGPRSVVVHGGFVADSNKLEGLWPEPESCTLLQPAEYDGWPVYRRSNDLWFTVLTNANGEIVSVRSDYLDALEDYASKTIGLGEIRLLLASDVRVTRPVLVQAHQVMIGTYASMDAQKAAKDRLGWETIGMVMPAWS